MLLRQNPRAHLWGRFFAAFQGENVSAHKTLAHATNADVEAERTTQWEKKGNDGADTCAKLGARVHDSAVEIDLDARGCSLVVSEAVRWAVEQEVWLADNGLVDAQSIVDPPLAKNPALGDEEGEEELCDSPPCDGAFRGHCIVAFQQADGENFSPGEHSDLLPTVRLRCRILSSPESHRG